MKSMQRSALAFAVGLMVGSALHVSAGGQSAGSDDGQRVTGIGGVFFKADDPSALRAWYERHLGIDAERQGVNFFWRDRENASRFGRTVWSVFPRDTEYFGPGDQDAMINYRVRDLDALLARLRDAGVRQVGETEDYWYGRFAWILDGEDNRVELWEPVDSSPEEFDRRVRDESN